MSEVAYVGSAPSAPFLDHPGRGAYAQPTDPDISPALAMSLAASLVSDLAEQFGAMNLFERVAAIRSFISGRIVFTTSFGLEAQALAHAIFSQSLAIDVATLDTGRLFPETHEVWAETERRYGVRIAAFAPEHRSVERLIARQGIGGFRSSVSARLDCCTIRKVAPFARILAGSSAWITGMRADQSADRARLAAASVDKQRQLIKVNPMFDWTREQVLEFVRTNDVPYNALHNRGFLSIGCAPCTRAVAPGEPERAGRWWWEQAEKKECGLHLADEGRVAPAAASHP
jgi:phosphoadenosine phosphosulfate reductase